MIKWSDRLLFYDKKENGNLNGRRLEVRAGDVTFDSIHCNDTKKSAITKWFAFFCTFVH